MGHKLFKLGAAAAITFAGASTISSLKPVAASTFKKAIKKIKINYLPKKGVKIWTDYNAGRFMGFRAKAGTEWNVVKSAVDKSGNLWYMVGDSEWIQARYTIDVDSSNSQHKVSDNKTKLFRPKKNKLVAAAQKAKSKVVGSTKKTKKSKNKSASSQAPVGAINSVVSMGQSEVGKKYIWGASGPDSFDCSGLVQYVYAKAAGMNLPRTTYDQVKVGQTVAMDQLKPGDLLFWGSTNAPYHVALYIGNNQYVDAATPEQGVVLQTISSYYYPTVAKRVLNSI